MFYEYPSHDPRAIFMIFMASRNAIGDFRFTAFISAKNKKNSAVAAVMISPSLIESSMFSQFLSIHFLQCSVATNYKHCVSFWFNRFFICSRRRFIAKGKKHTDVHGYNMNYTKAIDISLIFGSRGAATRRKFRATQKGHKADYSSVYIILTSSYILRLIF